MSVSAIGSSASYEVTKTATALLKKFDSSEDGSVDKAEFVKGLTSLGISEQEAGAQFDSMDANKTGKLSQGDFESALSASKDSALSEASAATTTKSSPGGAAKAEGATSASKEYDKKDLNEDGTVSVPEELIYDMKHAANEATDKAQAVTSRNAGKIVDENA